MVFGRYQAPNTMETTRCQICTKIVDVDYNFAQFWWFGGVGSGCVQKYPGNRLESDILDCSRNLSKFHWKICEESRKIETVFFFQKKHLWLKGVYPFKELRRLFVLQYLKWSIWNTRSVVVSESESMVSDRYDTNQVSCARETSLQAFCCDKRTKVENTTQIDIRNH